MIISQTTPKIPPESTAAVYIVPPAPLPFAAAPSAAIRRPAATAAAFDENGYFRTGDYGRLDGDILTLTGRLKNLIILSNGKNVYPEELECDIQGVWGVNEVVVYQGVCKNNPEKELIVAEIYPDYDAFKAKGIEDIRGYFASEIKKINDRNVAYKFIGRVKLRTEEFPKNTLRKIMRFRMDTSID